MTKYRIRVSDVAYGFLKDMTKPAPYVNERDLDRLRRAVESASTEQVLLGGRQFERRVFVIDQTGYLLLWQLVTGSRSDAPRAWLRFADQALRDANTARAANLVDLIGSLDANERTIDLG